MSREETHYVNRNRIRPPFPEATQLAYFAMGCFWGAERLFWNIPGVYSTAVGYSGGQSANPTYEEVCTGRTGHAETVQVVFDPAAVPYARLLKAFWESHNPTTLNRQGNDCGTQYRSAIFCTSPGQLSQAQASKAAYQAAIGKPVVVTEILAASEFFYAEDYHQQYLGKHPDGYCGLGGLGVECPGL